MSWEKDTETNTVTFYCDGPTCDAVHNCRVLHNPTNASAFGIAWKSTEEAGWRSFKKVGRDWEYFCPACVPAAEEAQRIHNDQERERERIKERNARYFE